MRFGRRLRLASGAFLAAVMSVAGIAFGQPAQAQSTYISVYETWLNGCPSGYVCLHFDPQLQYQGYGYYSDVWDMATIPSPYRTMNNNSGSARNSGTGSYSYVRFYDYAGGSGTSRCLRPGYSTGSMPGLYKQASALVWASSCGSVPQF